MFFLFYMLFPILISYVFVLILISYVFVLILISYVFVLILISYVFVLILISYVYLFFYVLLQHKILLYKSMQLKYLWCACGHLAGTSTWGLACMYASCHRCLRDDNE
jgi:hypothetical protein